MSIGAIGVREYIVWRVQDREVDWFVLRDGRIEPLAPSADGILRSAVFPGLWLDPAALLRGDLAAVLGHGPAGPELARACGLRCPLMGSLRLG